MDLQELFHTTEPVECEQILLTAEQANHIRRILVNTSASYSTNFMCNAFKIEKALEAGDLKFTQHLLFDCLKFIELEYKLRGVLSHDIHGLTGHGDQFCEKTISFGKTSEKLLEINKEVDGLYSHWTLGKECIHKARNNYKLSKSKKFKINPETTTKELSYVS